MSYNPFSTEPNQDENWSPMQQGAPRTPGQTFAMMSATLAVIGIVTFFTGFFPLFFGSLAVIFALLSRGQGNLSKPARVAIPLGTISMIIGVAVIVFAVVSIIRQFGSFENYYMLIQQQVDSYTSGDSTTFDMSQFMENFGGQ